MNTNERFIILVLYKFTIFFHIFIKPLKQENFENIQIGHPGCINGFGSEHKPFSMDIIQ